MKYLIKFSLWLSCILFTGQCLATTQLPSKCPSASKVRDTGVYIIPMLDDMYGLYDSERYHVGEKSYYGTKFLWYLNLVPDIDTHGIDYPHKKRELNQLVDQLLSQLQEPIYMKTDLDVMCVYNTGTNYIFKAVTSSFGS